MLVNKLLKRISDLEFEVERVNSIIYKLEEHLLEVLKENKDKKDDTSITMVAQTNYIYNYLQFLKGSDKE